MSPVEGRLYIPQLEQGKCNSCAVCMRGCPAEFIPEQRREPSSLRGLAYRDITAAPALPASPRTMPVCQEACPLHQDIRGYISLIARGAFREALDVIRDSNPLPSVTGYVCHHPCEEACTRNLLDAPLPIKALKRFVADSVEVAVRPSHGKGGKKVAVVGSGPAGLTAAHDLAAKGHAVEIIEANAEPGGMLRWAIPDFRLPRHVLKRDIEYIERVGVSIRAGIRFGSEVTLEDLRREGAGAVILAVGTHKPVPLDIDGWGTKKIIDCLDFLRRYANGGGLDIGERVVVIGGGNAALDAARTALRCGAREVEILYRRSREEMPADRSEVSRAEAEGVKITCSGMPVRLREVDSRFELECLRTTPGAADESGRRKPEPVPSSEFGLEASTVISAVGQLPDAKGINTGLTRSGLVKADESGATDLPGVFAAGDAVSGAGTVVQAMAHGRLVAKAVAAFLAQGQSL